MAPVKQEGPSKELLLLLDVAAAYTSAAHRALDYRDLARTWRLAFLVVCVQFTVVAVAAVWGWAR